MGGPNTTQTRFVGIIMSTIIYVPLAFHVPIDGGAIIILYLLPESCMHVREINVIILARRGGGLTVALFLHLASVGMYIVDVNIPTHLTCIYVLFGPPIPTSSFSFSHLFFYSSLV